MAGGFMSGFGSAFADSFNAARERSARREDDMFKIRFDQYTKKLEKVQETKAEQAKRVRQAKSLVERTGVDSNMWPKIYDQLESSSESAVEKWLTENDFSITAADPAQPQTADDPSATNLPQAASGAVDSQMRTSGLGLTPPKEGEGLFAGVENASGIDIRSNRDDRVMNRLSETTGQSPEAIKATLGADTSTVEPLAGSSSLQVSWKPKNDPKKWEINSIEEAANRLTLEKREGTPESIEKAQAVLDSQIAVVALKAQETAKANGTFVEPSLAAVRINGEFKGYAYKEGDQWIDPATREVYKNTDVQPFNKAQMEQLETIKKDTMPDVIDYTTRAENLASMAVLSAEMQEIVTRSPGAAGMAGDFAQWLDKNALGIGQLLESVAGKAPSQAKGEKSNFTMEGLQMISQQENELAEYIKSFSGDEMHRLALDAALLDAKATRLAYAWGMTLGQTGRSVTQQEFDAFKQSALGNGNPTAMMQGTADFMLGEYAALKVKQTNLNSNHPSIKFFEASNGGMPSPYKPATDLDILMEGNPKVKDILEKMKMVGTTGTPRPASTPEQQGGPVQIQSVDEYNALQPGARYIDPNGVPRIKGQK